MTDVPSTLCCWYRRNSGAGGGIVCGHITPVGRLSRVVVPAARRDATDDRTLAIKGLLSRPFGIDGVGGRGVVDDADAGASNHTSRERAFGIRVSCGRRGCRSTCRCWTCCLPTQRGLPTGGEGEGRTGDRAHGSDECAHTCANAGSGLAAVGTPPTTACLGLLLKSPDLRGHQVDASR